MLKLDLKKEPFWLEVKGGVRVRVRPFTSAFMNAAQASVRKDILDMREERLRRIAANTAIGDLPDVDNDEVRHGLIQSLLVKALARAAIIEWQGVLLPDSEDVAPVADNTVNDLMDIWFVAQDFWEKYTNSLALLEAEGNGSRPVANGTSAAGRATAKPARKQTSRAAKAKQAS